MQQPRDVMIVITNAESLFDQVANHRTGPDARLVASLDRPQLDDDGQCLALLLGKLGRRALGNARSQALDVVSVVPLQPAIHAAASNARLVRDVRDPPAIDIRPDGTSSTPFGKVVLQLCLDDECVELLELCGASTCAADRPSSIGLRHDRLTMILC